MIGLLEGLFTSKTTPQVFPEPSIERTDGGATASIENPRSDSSFLSMLYQMIVAPANERHPIPQSQQVETGKSFIDKQTVIPLQPATLIALQSGMDEETFFSNHEHQGTTNSNSLNTIVAEMTSVQSDESLSESMIARLEKEQKSPVGLVHATEARSQEEPIQGSTTPGLREDFPMDWRESKQSESTLASLQQATSVETASALQAMADQFTIEMPKAGFRADVSWVENLETEDTKPNEKTSDESVIPVDEDEVDINVEHEEHLVVNRTAAQPGIQNEVVDKPIVFEVQHRQSQNKPDFILPIQNAETLSMLQLPEDFAHNLIVKITDELKIHIEGKSSEVRVMMKPESLGELSLRVSMEEGMLIAKMDVSQPVVKSVLEAQLPQLREALAAQGIDVKRFEIVMSTDMHFQQSREGVAYHQRSRSKHNKDVDAAEKYETVKYLGYNTVEYII